MCERLCQLLSIYRLSESKSLYPEHDYVTSFREWLLSFEFQKLQRVEFVLQHILSITHCWSPCTVVVCDTLGPPLSISLLNYAEHQSHRSYRYQTRRGWYSREVACFTTAFFIEVTTTTLSVNWEQSRIWLFSNHIIELWECKKENDRQCQFTVTLSVINYHLFFP